MSRALSWTNSTLLATIWHGGMCEACHFASTSHRKSQCCLLNNAVQFVLTQYMHADVASLIVSASSKMRTEHQLRSLIHVGFLHSRALSWTNITLLATIWHGGMFEACHFANTTHRKSQCCLLTNAVQFVLTQYACWCCEFDCLCELSLYLWYLCT
jgi:hypothetical protein